MDDQTKCEIYTKLLNSLNKNGEIKEEIDKNTYDSQIQLIKTDLLSKINSDQETALQMLKILIENNIQDIRRDVIIILRDKAVDQRLKISILESCKNYLKDLLYSNNVADIVSFCVYWETYDLQKFYELLANACLEDSQDDSQFQQINFANILTEHFLPIISSPDTINLRKPLIKVASKIAEMFPISNLSEKEYQDFLKGLPGFLGNIVSLKQSSDNIWKEVLCLLTKYLHEKLDIPEVQELFNKSSLNWNLVHSDLDNNLQSELEKCISENNLVEVTRLFNDWRKLDPAKFTASVKGVCQNSISRKFCTVFLLNKVIPVIMTPKDMCDPAKVNYIEFALEFASVLPITELSTDEYNKFVASVNDYIKNISDLKDMNFAHWHKLWMFLVRFFGKKLHQSMSLINRLLRVVEHAFRNSSYEQRLRGYDCWKELIDNVSLDSQHISSEKQIRLLLTPLRAKFSKQEAVILKRFEVFVYLIKKLQDKAVLVLKEFLEFCFGEVGENTDPNKAGQGKGLPELWHRSAKVLLAALGHSHNSNDHCLETDSEICFPRPILNSNNISNYYCHVINSVAESCILLKDVELNQHRNTVLNCFWTSLLGIILDDKSTNKVKGIDVFGKMLQNILKDDDPYCNGIAAIILKCTIKFDWSKASDLILNKLDVFIGIIFSVPLNKESCVDIEKFQTVLCSVESAEITPKINQNLFGCFAKHKTAESNANFVAQFWIFLVNELDDYAKHKCLDFLVWPALHTHHVTDQAKEVLIYENYNQIVSKFVEKFDDLQLALFKNFEKLLKNNPLLLKNILTLIMMFSPKTENKEITNTTLDILNLMIAVPVVDDGINRRQNIELYLKKIYESDVTNLHDQDTIKKLSTCLQHILKFKHYNILTTVEASLRPLPENIKWIHGKFLSLDFLMDLFEKETDIHATEKIHKLIEVFRNLKNPDVKKEISSFIPLGGRSAKIAKLVKQIPPSPGKRSDSPSALRLFGKNIDTHSPFKVKGSQLKDIKDTPTKAKSSTPTMKTKKAVSIDDESNSKFVLIESEVKVDKTKLTDHQKEALKRRPEDIPALYQDLSQSVTQSFDSNSANGKIEETADIFKKPEEVEVNNKNIETVKDKKDKSTSNSTDAIVEEDKQLEENITPVIDKNPSKYQNEISETEILEHNAVESVPQRKEELKKAAVDAELKKLSMSIVGADEFLVASSKRKRRERKRDQEENVETKSAKEEKKPKDSDDQKSKKDDDDVAAALEQENEDKKKIPVPENNEPKKLEVTQVKKRGVWKSESPLTVKTTTPCISTIGSDDNVSNESDITPVKSSEITDMNTSGIGVIKKEEEPLRMKRKSLAAKKDESENEEKNYENHTEPVADMSEKHPRTIELDSKEVKKKSWPRRKSFPAKIETPENGTRTSEENCKLPRNEVVTESTNIDKKEVAIKKRGRPLGAKSLPNKKDTPESSFKDGSAITPRKRGRRFGVKKNPSVKQDNAEGTLESPNSMKNKLQHQSETPAKITSISASNLEINKVDTSLSVDTDSSVISEKDGDGKKKRKRRKRKDEDKRKSLLSNADGDSEQLEEAIETKPTDIYEFNTDQEKATENEIISLRSPIKDLPIVSSEDKEKKKRHRKSLTPLFRMSKTEMVASSGRKSKRKIIPTEKFTQSELFKSSEQSPGILKFKKIFVSPKVLPSSNEDFEKGKLPAEKFTQSELFVQTESRSKTVEGDEICKKNNEENIQSNDINSVLKAEEDDKTKESQTKPNGDNENLNINENTFKTGIKRKRPSTDEEDDDIIESSQESSTTNVSTAKLRWSLSKRCNFDNSTSSESKQSIIEIKETFDKAKINNDTVKPELPLQEKKQRRSARSLQNNESTENQSDNGMNKLEVSPEEKNRRKRPSKSAVCQNRQNDEDKSAESQSGNTATKVEVTPEEKKPKRGRPPKSPVKNSSSFADQSELSTEVRKHDNSVETDSDKIKRDVTPEEKKRRGRPPKSPVTKIETAPGEIKAKRGRARKSPLKSDDLFDPQKSQNESTEESQSLVTISGKSLGVNEETAAEENKSKRLECKTKESVNGDADGTKLKSQMHEMNAGESEPLKESSDGNNLTKHDEKLRKGRRKSPFKPEKSHKPIDETVHKVKKQVFPEIFKKPANLDTSTQDSSHRTQSQDTQTQDTPSMDITNDEIQLQLDLPQKPVMNETDKHIARMDTASLSLGDVEELRGFDISDNEKTRLEINKTVVENKTLTTSIRESESVIYSSEETGETSSVNKKEESVENDNVSKDEIFTISENIISSGHAVESSGELSEFAETEETTSDALGVHEAMDNWSPVKEQTAADCIGTPGFLETSIPSSPVTGDTPNRTSELLNCTSDISPIGSKSSSDKSSSDDEFIEQRKLIPVALKFDNEDADLEANKEKSPEKADDAPEKINEMSPDKAEKEVDKATSSSPPKDQARTSRDLKSIAERSNRLFEMVKSGSPATHRLFGKRKAGHNMSPSASRIKKLMSNIKAPSQDEFTENVGQEDILTFSREVPSPLAVPRSSILKRKHSDTTEDGMSPCAKRKRVNFSDPCTTSKKVFIKEDNGTSQCLFGSNSGEELDKQFLEVLAANNIIDTPQTESDSIETEQSLQVNNPLLLRDDVPIYPDLIDCEESVNVISRKLTSPMFVNALLSKLNGRNIKTIGDLAKQSEVSIARLPFKTPMVTNVYKALDIYYYKNFKCKVSKEKTETRVSADQEKCETRINGEQETENEVVLPLSRLRVALVKMDVKDELLKVLERALSQNMSVETLCSLLFSVIDQKDVLAHVKTYSNFETKDILHEKDFPDILRHITETIGLPKIFKILTESSESPEGSDYLDSIIKKSIEEKPFSSLMQKRSLQELQAALWENVENKTYTKKELLDTCFFPFVNSIDISPVFNKMSVVQINEIVISRLKEEEYVVFIKRILEKSSCNPEVKEEFLSHCTINDLTSSIIKKGSPKEIISSLTYMFLSVDKDKNDLVQIFRLVSENLVNVLPPSKLMELSIEFQKKIPIKD